jgi:hypothetical protein
MIQAIICSAWSKFIRQRLYHITDMQSTQNTDIHIFTFELLDSCYPKCYYYGLMTIRLKRHRHTDEKQDE